MKTKLKVGDTYQWYKNGVVIAGATSNIYIATTTGTYYVRQTSPAGCFKKSTSVIVTSTCRTGVETVEISVSPNPVADYMIIDIQNDAPAQQAILQIINSTGQIVLTNQIQIATGAQQLIIEMPSTLANGMYVLQMQFADRLIVNNIMLTR